MAEKRKADSLIDLNVYEIFSVSDVTLPMRMIYMGKDSWGTAKEAKDVLDILNKKGMENLVVLSCKRKILKNRIKRQKKVVVKVKKDKIQSLNDIAIPKKWFGSYQPLHGSLNAKGKQMTWWITNALQMDGSDYKENIRDAALMIRQVPAEMVIKWTKITSLLDNELNAWPLHIQDDTNKDKIRQMTFRIRQSIIKCSDKKHDVRVSDGVSLASA